MPTRKGEFAIASQFKISIVMLGDVMVFTIKSSVWFRSVFCENHSFSISFCNGAIFCQTPCKKSPFRIR